MHFLKDILTTTSKFPVSKVPHLLCFTSSFAFSIETQQGILSPTEKPNNTKKQDTFCILHLDFLDFLFPPQFFSVTRDSTLI